MGCITAYIGTGDNVNEEVKMKGEMNKWNFVCVRSFEPTNWIHVNDGNVLECTNVFVEYICLIPLMKLCVNNWKFICVKHYGARNNEIPD